MSYIYGRVLLSGHNKVCIKRGNEFYTIGVSGNKTGELIKQYRMDDKYENVSIRGEKK